MNTTNNKRRKNSQEKIIKVFLNLIQSKEIHEISVSDICKQAEINRSTFYANYIDIYDLVDKIKDRIMEEFIDIYKEEKTAKSHSYDFLKLFKHIKENQIFYKTYFKLNLDIDAKFINFNVDEETIKFYGTNKYSEYHIAFFKAGLNAIIQKWLKNNCKETPKEINNIIINEYTTHKKTS